MSDVLWSFWRVDGCTHLGHWHESRSQINGNAAERDGTASASFWRMNDEDERLKPNESGFRQRTACLIVLCITMVAVDEIDERPLSDRVFTVHSR